MVITEHAKERLKERMMDHVPLELYSVPRAFLIVDFKADGSHVREVTHEGMSFYALFQGNVMVTAYGDFYHNSDLRKVRETSDFYRRFLKKLRS